MAYDTAANILNDAAVELGLLSADVADPYASTDPNVLQLCRLLKGLGQDLLRDFAWSHLQKTHTFSTVNGTAAYDMPADYARTINQTHWNRTDARPLLGPVPAQGWQYLKAVSSSASVDSAFRIFNDQINIHPTPTAAETVAFEYVSRYWVKPSGQTAPTSEAPTIGTDALHFDRRLLVLGLKLSFRGNKGFDTLAADPDFAAAYARAKNGDGAAPVLSLNASGSVPLLGLRNLPDTGYGL